MALNFLTMDLDTVTVHVGKADTSVDITVYRDILSAVSPYFRSAFEGPFVEATDRSISLTDVTEKTFRMFLQWTQTQNNQRPSGATFPKHEILIRRSTAKSADINAMSPTELHPPRNTTLALDEAGDRNLSISNKDLVRLYFKNPEWVEGYRLSLLSFLRLYAFANKYNVPQLRDDVLTAMVSQSMSWNGWPDLEQGVIELAYAMLPASSKFIRFFVLSTAYVWLSQDGNCSATKLRILRELNEDFAFDVMVVQNQRLQHKRLPDRMPSRFEGAVPNACILHEHLVQDAEHCRKRVRDQPYIFTGLIEMCAQDASTTAKESEEE